MTLVNDAAPGDWSWMPNVPAPLIRTPLQCTFVIVPLMNWIAPASTGTEPPSWAEPQ
ncbi:hypothetical protein ACRAKI_17405 [Saccharothrix isguenensis]